MTDKTPRNATTSDPAAASPGDSDLGYEEARDQLVAVVQQLESGSATLQESVDLWERGEQLADICQRWLDGARARLDAATHVEPSDTEG